MGILQSLYSTEESGTSSSYRVPETINIIDIAQPHKHCKCTYNIGILKHFTSLILQVLYSKNNGLNIMQSLSATYFGDWGEVREAKTVQNCIKFLIQFYLHIPGFISSSGVRSCNSSLLISAVCAYRGLESRLLLSSSQQSRRVM